MRDEVFIVGGGSSLSGFDFQKLKNRDTIAINMSALDVPNPTYCITADSGIFRKIQTGYFKDIEFQCELANALYEKYKDSEVFDKIYDKVYKEK